MTVANKDPLLAIKIKRELRVNVTTNDQLDLGPKRRFTQYLSPVSAAHEITAPAYSKK